MLKKIKTNIKFLRRYFSNAIPTPFRSNELINHKNIEEIKSQNLKERKMNPLKSLFIFCAKIIAFLILTNIIVVKPLSTAISKGLEGFDNNPLIKIISLDFINNPLTFIRMSQYYLDKGDLKKAMLYLQYAETIKSRYPYPSEIKSQILELQSKLKNLRP